MEINSNQIKNADNINNNIVQNKETPKQIVTTEVERQQLEYPSAGVLKSYAGIIQSKDDFISAKEFNEYCDFVRINNEKQKEYLQNVLANEDGNVSRKTFDLFKSVRKKSTSLINAINISNAAKENGKINNQALNLIDSLVPEGSKFVYGFDADFLGEIKNPDGKFDTRVLNLFSENKDALNGYLLRRPEIILNTIKDSNKNLDLGAVEFWENNLKSGVKTGDIVNNILAGKDSNGKFSKQIFSVYDDLKKADLELWQINKVRSILPTFKPEEKDSAKQFIELAKAMKDDKFGYEALDIISDINSETPSKAGLKYNKESIDFVKKLMGEGYYDGDNINYVLKHLDKDISKINSNEFETLKRLLQFSNREHVQTIFDASIDKAGPQKGKLRFDKMNKNLDLYFDGVRDVNIDTIKHLSNCLSLEENDDAFNTFHKLYTMKWLEKDKYSSYSNEMKLDRDTLDFMLSLSTQEVNGIPKRKCIPETINRLNKLMSMKLPMVSRDAFNNFMFASDIKNIEKLERVNLLELGLNAEDITSAKLQNLPEENLIKLKTFLKDYLKDKDVSDIRINNNSNLADLIEITKDSSLQTYKLLYDIKNNEPINDIIEKNYINSNAKDILQKDYKHGIEVKQRFLKTKDNLILENQKIEKYDKDNKLLYTEEIKPSNAGEGYDIVRTYPDGKIDNFSHTYKTKYGTTVVEKNMVSLDGTKSYYRFEDDPQGNRILDYKITSKDGKKLMDESVTFEVIDDNHFVTSRNNKKFDIQIKDNNMNIKDLQSGKIANIELENFTKSTQKDILPVLKQIPGEDLFQLKSMDIQSIARDDRFANAAFSPNKNIIGMNQKYLNPEILLHEIGHGKDHLEFKEIGEKINNDKLLNEIYNKEKEAFRAHFSDAELSHIGYFAADYHYLGRSKAIMEGIAESNTILSMAAKNNIQTIRSHYWMQYFPKTIAYIAKLIH